MTTQYDTIVVGARCAGSPTAMLLARKGYRVLLLDRASFPSDTLSTHVIHAPGMAALRRWGLLDQVVASGCPPIRTYGFDLGPFTIHGTPRPFDGVATAYAPRRTVLDKLLVDAAAHAGAEIRERFTVQEIVVEDGVVVGIRGRGANGQTVLERARVVIGADGRNSLVARAVGAQRYHEKPKLAWAAYTYWSDLPVDGMQAGFRPGRAGWGAMPTNDGLTVLIVGWPIAEAAAYRADVEGNYLATLELAPELGELVRGATRQERFKGGASPNFLRTPSGPGWALVGDAGYTKDPVTAQGISDAFRDAALCSAALDQTFAGGRPFAEAMATYQRTRDAQVLGIYELTAQFASLEPPPEEVQRLLGAVAGNRQAMDEFASVIAGTLSPGEFFDPANIEQILRAA
jgi:flavin-dependent dehydrogenase